VPAQAASTVGRETTVEDRCVREEEINLTYCITGTDRRIEVRNSNFVVAVDKGGYNPDSISCTSA
jgi:hypothetical protein